MTHKFKVKMGFVFLLDLFLKCTYTINQDFQILCFILYAKFKI